MAVPFGRVVGVGWLSGKQDKVEWWPQEKYVHTLEPGKKIFADGVNLQILTSSSVPKSRKGPYNREEKP